MKKYDPMKNAQKVTKLTLDELFGKTISTELLFDIHKRTTDNDCKYY